MSYAIAGLAPHQRGANRFSPFAKHPDPTALSRQSDCHYRADAADRTLAGLWISRRPRLIRLHGIAGPKASHKPGRRDRKGGRPATAGDGNRLDSFMVPVIEEEGQRGGAGAPHRLIDRLTPSGPAGGCSSRRCGRRSTQSRRRCSRRWPDPAGFPGRCGRRRSTSG